MVVQIILAYVLETMGLLGFRILVYHSLNVNVINNVDVHSTPHDTSTEMYYTRF